MSLCNNSNDAFLDYISQLSSFVNVLMFWLNEWHKAGLIHRSVSWGHMLGTGPWWVQAAGLQPVLLALRASELHCIRGQMPWHLHPGLVSNHQHVLALSKVLWAGQSARPAALCGADCWPWWSLISIIHYPRLQISQGPTGASSELHSQGKVEGHMWGCTVPGQQGNDDINRKSAGYSGLDDVINLELVVESFDWQPVRTVVD